MPPFYTCVIGAICGFLIGVGRIVWMWRMKKTSDELLRGIMLLCLLTVAGVLALPGAVFMIKVIVLAAYPLFTKLYIFFNTTF